MSAGLRASLVLGLLCVACHPCGPPAAPVERPEAPDAANNDICPAFCARLTALGCPGRTGSPGADEELGTFDDVSCTEVCRNIIASGLYKPRFSSCLTNAKSCDRADSCLMGD